MESLLKSGDPMNRGISHDLMVHMGNTRKLQTKVCAMRTPLSAVCLQLALVGVSLAGVPSSDDSRRLTDLNESDPPSLLVPSGWKASWDPEGKHLVYGLNDEVPVHSIMQ